MEENLKALKEIYVALMELLRKKNSKDEVVSNLFAQVNAYKPRRTEKIKFRNDVLEMILHDMPKKK